MTSNGVVRQHTEGGGSKPSTTINPYSIQRILRCILLAGFVYTLVACQAATPANPTVAEMKTAQPTNLATGITGQVTSASDVAGTPDRPLPEQLILAIPRQHAESILGSGVNSLPDTKLRFLKAFLAQQNPSIAIALSDASGYYTIVVPAGVYLVCIADSETASAQFPATTRGCGLVQVEPNTLQHVDISSGFGEIILQQR